MVPLLDLRLLTALAGLAFPSVRTVSDRAQATVPASPAATPAAADPKSRVPAEIVPSTPGNSPATVPGGKDVTPPSPPLSPGTKAPPGAAAAANVKATVDSLSDKELDEILAVLKQRYVTPGALSDAELKRATVQGLLQRLGASVALSTPGAGTPATEAADSAPSPFRSAALGGGKIAYLRLGALDAAGLEELDKALAQFSQPSVKAQVLDLRALPSGVDLEAAAEVCRRWCAKGKPLFSVRRPTATAEQIFTSKGEPLGRGMLLVLTSSRSAGSAEIIAATLRAFAKAVVIGQKTKGDVSESAEVNLSSGKLLRFAVAEVKLANGEPLGPVGVTPDIAVNVPPAATAEVLRLGLEQGAASLLPETERPRMNEAALVAGRNPEVDAIEAAQRTHGAPKPPLRDIVLQRAVDLVASIEVFEKRATK